jgi:hypothetical protein
LEPRGIRSPCDHGCTCAHQPLTLACLERPIGKLDGTFQKRLISYPSGKRRDRR